MAFQGLIQEIENPPCWDNKKEKGQKEPFEQLLTQQWCQQSDGADGGGKTEPPQGPSWASPPDWARPWPRGEARKAKNNQRYFFKSIFCPQQMPSSSCPAAFSGVARISAPPDVSQLDVLKISSNIGVVGTEA